MHIVAHEQQPPACTLFIPVEYNTRLILQINNTILNMHTDLKIVGLTLDPKLSYNKHIDNMAAKISKMIPIPSPLDNQVEHTQGDITLNIQGDITLNIQRDITLNIQRDIAFNIQRDITLNIHSRNNTTLPLYGRPLRLQQTKLQTVKKLNYELTLTFNINTLNTFNTLT